MKKKQFKNSILIDIPVVVYYINQGANACNLVAFCLVYYLPTFFLIYNVNFYEGASFWSVRQDSRIPMYYALCRVQNIIFCWGIFFNLTWEAIHKNWIQRCCRGGNNKHLRIFIVVPKFLFHWKEIQNRPHQRYYILINFQIIYKLNYHLTVHMK